MPGACCTRGLVCNVCIRVRTRAYRYSRSTPAFPAQWFDGLCRALPGDEFVLPPSLANWRLVEPGWVRSTSASLTPATGARTTRFCRTLQRRTSCAPCSLTGEPALRTLFTPDAAASTTSRLAFVTIAIRPSCRDGTARKQPLIWGDREEVYICKDDWTAQIRLNPFSKLDFTQNPIAGDDRYSAHPTCLVSARSNEGD